MSNIIQPHAFLSSTRNTVTLTNGNHSLDPRSAALSVEWFFKFNIVHSRWVNYKVKRTKKEKLMRNIIREQINKDRMCRLRFEHNLVCESALDKDKNVIGKCTFAEGSRKRNVFFPLLKKVSGLLVNIIFRPSTISCP